MIHTKDHKTLNNSGSGASKTSPSVPLSKPPESTSSGPLRSSTAKTAAFQTRIRPFGLIYTLYTPAEGCSTSSEAGSPLFWSKSGFCPLTLSKHSVSQETGRFELLRNYQFCSLISLGTPTIDPIGNLSFASFCSIYGVMGTRAPCKTTPLISGLVG